MDSCETEFVVEGEEKGEPFMLRMKKHKRWRRGWSVICIDKNASTELTELPPRDPNIHVIFKVMDENGVLIQAEKKRASEKEDTSKSAEDEEVKEEDSSLLEDDIKEEPPSDDEMEELEFLLRDKVGHQEAQNEYFWVRQGYTPSLPGREAEGWRKNLKEASIREEKELTPVVLKGLARSTRLAHRRILKKIREVFQEPKEDSGISISRWLLETLEEEGKKRNWQGSTMATYMGSCQGALANLPIYFKDVPPVLLRHCPEWTLGLKGAGNAAKGGLANQAQIVTPEIMEKAIKEEPVLAVRAALEVAWVTAGRGGDIVKLRATDIECLQDEKNPRTRVRFVIGKTASSQPYTIVSAPLSKEAQGYVSGRREAMSQEGEKTAWLFPGIDGSMLKIALRRVGEKLEQRSIRRGAIQFLAGLDLSDSELMNYSQHKSIETLRRYLEWGWHSGEGKERGKKAEEMELFKKD